LVILCVTPWIRDSGTARNATYRRGETARRSLEGIRQHHLKSGATSRLEHSVDRKDLYRLTHALVDHCIASYPEPPAAIVLDLEHSDDQTHGQQALAFSNHHYRSYCSLPLCIFTGTSHALVTACLRPGTRPPGREHALILVRLLAVLRRHWPRTHILVRGDSHCATPEVCEVLGHRRGSDFIFGLAGNAVRLRPSCRRRAGSPSSEPPKPRSMASALPPAAVCMRSSPLLPLPGPSPDG